MALGVGELVTVALKGLDRSPLLLDLRPEV